MTGIYLLYKPNKDVIMRIRLELKMDVNFYS